MVDHDPAVPNFPGLGRAQSQELRDLHFHDEETGSSSGAKCPGRRESRGRRPLLLRPHILRSPCTPRGWQRATHTHAPTATLAALAPGRWTSTRHVAATCCCSPSEGEGASPRLPHPLLPSGPLRLPGRPSHVLPGAPSPAPGGRLRPELLPPLGRPTPPLGCRIPVRLARQRGLPEASR